jgi:hypothetical protein
VSRAAEFLSEYEALDVSEGRETRTFRLLSPLVVYSAVLEAELCVPAGFTFDGESIPPLLHWLVPPFGQSKRGACVHDYLYRHAGYFSAGVLNPVTRAQADAVYRELVALKGLPRWRATVRWATLRLVGWWAWTHQAASPPPNPASP